MRTAVAVATAFVGAGAGFMPTGVIGGGENAGGAGAVVVGGMAAAGAGAGAAVVIPYRTSPVDDVAGAAGIEL